MHISKIKISNYKSFIKSEFLEFEPGINIIIGQNNSGKTALLEALELSFENHPHRDIRNLTASNTINNQLSTVDIVFSFEQKDILKVVKDYEIGIKHARHASALLSDFNKWINQLEVTELLVENYRSNPKKYDKITIAECPTDFESYYRDHQFDTSKNPYNINTIVLYVNNDHNIQTKKKSVQYNYTTTLEKTIFDSFQSRIYRFSAQRFSTGTCYSGTRLYLEPNASNLAEVVSQIQLPGKRKIYQKFNDFVNTILPDVQMVSSRIKPLERSSVTGKEELEVLVWSPEAVEQDREDLALELKNCGTGVSQLIAILYVVVTTLEPAIIIIDEPQSFLHPNAVRKLIEIFKEVSRHQYIIATHSPQIISAVGSANIIKLSREKSETITQTIDPTQTAQLRSLLKELGVSLSDVFGADVILWVEGATEEICFPFILDKLGNFNLKGIQILAVINTGDFEGKRAHTIFDIYDKLSNSTHLLPPALGFIFDSENRSEQQKEKMDNGDRNVKFLPRCNYENYLIHPKAIATILNQINLEKKSITDVDIQDWITEAINQGKFLQKDIKLGSLSEEKWLKKVDGAKLLKSLFSDISQQTIEYRKTEHSVGITNWLIQNEISHFSELSQFLQEAIQEWSENCDQVNA